MKINSIFDILYFAKYKVKKEVNVRIMGVYCKRYINIENINLWQEVKLSNANSVKSIIYIMIIIIFAFEILYFAKYKAIFCNMLGQTRN